jgi:hypothetical protein
MIVVLYQNGYQEIANNAAEDLVKAFNDHTTRPMAAVAAAFWLPITRLTLILLLP